MDFWTDWRFSVRMDPLEHLTTWTIGFLSAVALCSVVVILAKVS